MTTETNLNFDKSKKEDIIHILNLFDQCKLTFTKINGEERTITCTLNPNIIPTPANTDANVCKDTITVWCTDSNSWKSFRYNNVISISHI